MLLGIIGWVLCGLVIAFIAGKVVNLHGDDPRLGLAIGGGAAFVGGWIYSLVSGSPVSGFNRWSLLFAVMAALVVTAAWNIYRSRRPHDAPSIRRSY